MKRRLFNLLVLLSAIWCAAALALWSTSRVRMDALSYSDGSTWHVIGLDGNGIRAVRMHNFAFNFRGWLHVSRQPGESPVGHHPTVQALGFGLFYATTEYSPGTMTADWTVRVPYWFLVLLTSVFPARWVLARRRQRRGGGFEVDPIQPAGQADSGEARRDAKPSTPRPAGVHPGGS